MMTAPDPVFERVYAHDTETYPNVFLAGFVHMGSGNRWIFEISERVNHSVQLYEFMTTLSSFGGEALGFNNEHFDCPVLQYAYERIATAGVVTAYEIYQKAAAIIAAPYNDWTHSVPAWQRVIPQIDLFKIMHFDNFAKSTSLKALQIAMKSETVEDLPIPPGTIIEPWQIDGVLIPYMCHDISETIKFAHLIKDDIAFRRELGTEAGYDMMNFNDTKIGKQTFIHELEAAGVTCYEKVNGRRRPIQTRREGGIHVREKLLPLTFRSEDLNDIWRFFERSVIPAHETKGFFTDLTAPCGGLDLHFGAGGLHGSVSGLRFDENDEWEILDIDVVSYYPSLAIVNRWYPEHLGATFCDIYADLKRRRVGYAKGSPQNQALKLALNGVYGDSNNEYSPFYDPAYTMAITINGQMLLAWLAEALSIVDGVKLIQVNTDGVTLYSKRSVRPLIDEMCQSWEHQTGLELEYVNYRLMAIRDVNNYLAVDTEGDVKRKNAYQTEQPNKRKPKGWHQDLSSLVVPKAACASIIDGVDIQDFVYSHTDAFDFMRRIKAPKKHRVELGGRTVQNTSRYFIALAGDPMFKIMPPLAGKTEERRNAVDKGWLIQECNNVADFDWNNLNRRFYVREARKLVDCIKRYEPRTK